MTDNPNVYQGPLGDSRPNDVQISPDGSTIYAAGADGNLYVYSTATGELLHTWDVGTQLGAMDISPDGKFAVVVETVPVGTQTNQWGDTVYIVEVHKVNLTTGAVTNYDYNANGDYTFSDVAILNNGTVLLTESLLPGYSGWVDPKVLDLATGQFSSTNMSVPGGSMLMDSSDGSFAVLAETNNSTGSVELYKPGIGFLPPINGTGYQARISAYSDAKGLLAYADYYDGVHVFDAAAQETLELPRLHSDGIESVVGVAFDQTGQFLFVLDASSDTITQLSTADWSVVREFAVGADINSANNYYGNMLIVAPDMSYFTVVTESGLIVVDPTAPPPPTEGADALVGTPSNDVIDGLGGADYLTGLGGDDSLHGGTGDDRMFGGDGNDTVDGGPGRNWLDGGAGNDVITGGDDASTLIGGTGSDALTGGSGDDILYSNSLPEAGPGWPDSGTDVDSLNGGAGDDVIFAGYGDNVDGGADFYGDRLDISFRAATAGISFDLHLSSQVIGGATITGIERIGSIEGSDFDDYINVESAEVVPWSSDQTGISGGGGNDTLIGGAQFWYLDGGDGDDILDGRASALGGVLVGGAGNDTIYAGSSTQTNSDGGDGDDTIYGKGYTWGGAGNDLIVLDGSPSEAAYGYVTTDGGSGNDQITGSAVADSISGGTGADEISGDDGNDFLFSDVGGDDAGPAWQNHYASLDAGSEHDVLIGGAGDDHIEAGYGDDVDGGTGTDALRLNLAGATAGVVLDTSSLASGVVIGSGTIQNVEQVVALRGTNFADTLTVSGGAPILVNGGGGNDTVNSTASDASLQGDNGDDVISSSGTGVGVDGGDGNDVIQLAGVSSYASGEAGDDRFLSTGIGNYFNGGIGFDTIDYSAALSGVTVDLLAQSGAGGDQLIEIEGVIGSGFADHINGTYGGDQLSGGAGSDILTGNNGDDLLKGDAGNDTLDGGDGNDTLDGGTGNDTLKGGTGNDIYYVDSASDVVTELASEGTDEVHTTITYTLGANVENGTLDGAAAANLTGNTLANTLTGNSAANILNGGAGADTMKGGSGNDIYYVDNASDVVTELTGQGTDEIRTSVTYALSSNVENAVAQGTAAINLSGNTLANALTGNAAANTLNGAAGNDTLKGGDGNDTLEGGAGTDTLEGDAGIDTFVYRTGGGRDTISDFAAGESINVYGYSAAQSVTQSGANVVVLFATGSQITVLNSTVSAVNSALHFMDGGGGGGGGGGTTGTSGNDALTGTSGDDVVSGLGGNDTLTGLAGNDTLNGGTGSDTMKGGAGNDIYYVDSALDKVTELVNEGTDEVRTTRTYTLGSNVENATAQGTTAINLTGNTLANVLTGNSAANTLSGGGGNDTLKGGLGADVLTGGAGADRFVYTDVNSGNDRITDFVSGSDKIDLHAFGITSANVHTAVNGTSLVISVDADHNGSTDFTITLTGVTHINSSDYIF